MNAVDFLAGLIARDDTPSTVGAIASGEQLANVSPIDMASERGLSPDGLSADLRERYEERAAIREFDGRQSRDVAEAGAMAEILNRNCSIRTC